MIGQFVIERRQTPWQLPTHRAAMAATFRKTPGTVATRTSGPPPVWMAYSVRVVAIVREFESAVVDVESGTAKTVSKCMQHCELMFIPAG